MLSFPAPTSCHSPVCVFGSISPMGFSSLLCIGPHQHLPFRFDSLHSLGLLGAQTFAGWVPSDPLGHEESAAEASRRMWQAGSASVGVTPNRVLGEGAPHFLEPNDSINRRMGKVGRSRHPLPPGSSALASGPDSGGSCECFSFTCVSPPVGWGRDVWSTVS